MTAAAERRGPPEARGRRLPSVEDAGPPSTLADFGREMAPRPGRALKALRLAGISLIIIGLCEFFRIPNAATVAYIAFITFKSDADATIPAALLGGVGIVFGILTTIVYFEATLSEPALRIPLMAAVAFTAVFLSRTSTLGPVAYAAGVFMVITLVDGDSLTGDALSPYGDTDAERPSLPSILYVSPEEALVENLLWMAFGIALASAVIVVVNHLTGPDPERKLREAVAQRLDAMASLCAGADGARHRVVDFARAGSAALVSQNELSGKLKGGRYRPAFGGGVIEALSRLTLVLLAFRRVAPAAPPSEALRAAGSVLSEAAAAMRAGAAMGGADLGERASSETASAASGSDPTAATALDAELSRSLHELRRAVNGTAPPDEAAAGGGLFKPGALSDPENTRFALKVTLAMMASYVFMNLADWPQISTCMTTCFVLALGSVGQSVHKMVLRISGALTGAAIGFGTTLFVVPALTDLGQLLLVMAPVLLAAAWIRVGSERTAYFGQQAAFAFMLTLLQGYGPTLHFETGRDRVVGILVGEIAFAAVFLHVWPVSVGSVVRKGTAGALGHLAAALKARKRREGARSLQRFADAVAAVRGLLADERYDPHRIRVAAPGPLIDDGALLLVQSLAVPASILTSVDHGDADADDAYLADVAGWLGRLATWVQHGTGSDDLRSSLPRAPRWDDARLPSARAAWCGILEGEMRDILDALGVDAPGADAAVRDGGVQAAT